MSKEIKKENKVAVKETEIKLLKISEMANKIHYNAFRLRQILRSPVNGMVYDSNFINYNGLKDFLRKNVGDEEFKKLFEFPIDELESHLDYSRGHRTFSNTITLEAVKKYHLNKKVVLKIHVNKYDVIYLGETQMGNKNYLLFKNVDNANIRTYEESYLESDFIKFYKADEDLESK